MNRALLAALAAMAVPLAAHAQGAAAPSANPQACAACHGARGEGTASGPRIAGQPAAYLERQLAAFADGRRDNPIMSPMAKLLSEADRRTLAAFFAGQSPSGKAAGAKASAGGRGATLAIRGDNDRRLPACQNCHGPGGRGLPPDTPGLSGLGADYLSTQLRELRSGARKGDPGGQDPTSQMSAVAKALGDADIAALAGYYAGLAPVATSRAPSGAPARGGSPAGGAQDTRPSRGTGVEGGGSTQGGAVGPGGGGGGSGSGPSGSRPSR
jgi:cytochrome c553